MQWPALTYAMEFREGSHEIALLVIAGCAAALAACNKGRVHEENASVEQVANAVRQSGVGNGILLRAGEWRVSGTMEEFNIPGMPPAGAIADEAGDEPAPAI